MLVPGPLSWLASLQSPANAPKPDGSSIWECKVYEGPLVRFISYGTCPGYPKYSNQVTWTCKAGHTNNPQEYLIFDLPCFECRCGCGKKFDNDFEFCMGDIKVNNHDVIGVPYRQVGPTCVASGYAKIMEITKRVKSIIEKKDPDLVPVMCAQDLVEKYEASIGKDESYGIQKVVHMAQILKEQGIRSEDEYLYSKCA